MTASVQAEAFRPAVERTVRGHALVWPFHFPLRPAFPNRARVTTWPDSFTHARISVAFSRQLSAVRGQVPVPLGHLKGESMASASTSRSRRKKSSMTPGTPPHRGARLLGGRTAPTPRQSRPTERYWHLGDREVVAFVWSGLRYGWRRKRPCSGASEPPKLLLGQARLLQDFAEGPGWQGTGVHRHICLAAVGVAQDLVATRLAHFCESRAQQSREDLTR